MLQLSRLLAAGFNMDLLVQAIELLKEIPWSTVPVEQAHGSMAVIHKLHPLLSRTVLAHRTMVRQCRTLFQTTEKEKSLAKLES